MKKLILKLVPATLLHKYRARQYSKSQSQFQGKTAEETFLEIYKTNHWNSNGSVSGTGSDATQTQYLVTILNDIVSELRPPVILDIPCGDFNWIKEVNFNGTKYIGGDIVKDLIEVNNSTYANENTSFQTINLIKDKLPMVDLVFTRDCLVHLCYNDIFDSIRNIKASGSKYLLTTTFIDHYHNFDITTGDWRPINLQKPPFNFPTPEKVISEECSEGNGEFKDKSLGLWLIKSLPDF